MRVVVVVVVVVVVHCSLFISYSALRPSFNILRGSQFYCSLIGAVAFLQVDYQHCTSYLIFCDDSRERQKTETQRNRTQANPHTNSKCTSYLISIGWSKTAQHNITKWREPSNTQGTATAEPTFSKQRYNMIEHQRKKANR